MARLGSRTLLFRLDSARPAAAGPPACAATDRDRQTAARPSLTTPHHARSCRRLRRAASSSWGLTSGSSCRCSTPRPRGATSARWVLGGAEAGREWVGQLGSGAGRTRHGICRQPRAGGDSPPISLHCTAAAARGRQPQAGRRVPRGHAGRLETGALSCWLPGCPASLAPDACQQL